MRVAKRKVLDIQSTNPKNSWWQKLLIKWGLKEKKLISYRITLELQFTERNRMYRPGDIISTETGEQYYVAQTQGDFKIIVSSLHGSPYVTVPRIEYITLFARTYKDA